MRGTSWESDFLDWLDAEGLGHPEALVDPAYERLGYRLPEGVSQLDPLPWHNVNKIVVQFSEGVNVEQGDLLLLYSDGVTEATSPENAMFDVAGLKTVMTRSAHESSEMLIGRIDSSLHRFVKSDELQDDATMVAIKMK